MHTLFHITSSARRSAIARFGLLPGKPTSDGNYVRDEYFPGNRLLLQRRGVYAFTSFRQAIMWPHWDDPDMPRIEQVPDVYAFHARDMEYYIDPMLQDCAYVVPMRVPPSHIMRLDGWLVDEARTKAHHRWDGQQQSRHFDAYCMKQEYQLRTLMRYV